MPEPLDAFADLHRRISQQGGYLDPVNRARDAYLRGDIDVEELELRVGDLIGWERPGRHERTLRRLRMGGNEGGK